jgi:hypothetical protein
MKSFTNHTAGARGINIEGGTTTWIEPGHTVEIDPETIVGDVPDLGRPADTGAKLDAANTELAGQVDALTAQVTDLQGQLDAANTELAPHRIREAVSVLDHKTDAHWTKAGLPATEAVSSLVGSDVSRADIDAAASDAKRNPPA